MKLTKEKREILLCALAQLLKKNKDEANMIQELCDELYEQIEVID